MSNHYTLDIIYNTNATLSNVVVAKFKVSSCKTIYSTLDDFSDWIDDDDKVHKEYCAVFHTKNYCFTFFLYEKDGVIVKNKTSLQKEVYDTKRKEWFEGKSEYYYFLDNEITINDVVQKRVDRE